MLPFFRDLGQTENQGWLSLRLWETCVMPKRNFRIVRPNLPMTGICENL